MYSDGSALQQLSREECLMLMASVPVGRIIYTRRALPAVELVNFTLDHGDVVIRTDRGGKLAAAARGAVVAFEADQLDLAGHPPFQSGARPGRTRVGGFEPQLAAQLLGPDGQVTKTAAPTPVRDAGAVVGDLHGQHPVGARVHGD